ncbi:hypothetical protein CC78DRAFT_30361 [Lojkania enalia]|uniref:Uncharacterized protein n=1 Tax=Lojkania enalia TaxID=147567 RepID=A0A9P4K527_9PLEO|nr:hypothetical protein CC78DRAFT_30361 [Didymosphaeria enalia]
MEPKEMQKAEENETLLPISEPTEKRRTPRKQRNIFIHWTLIACSITAGVAAGYLLGHHQKGGSVNYGLPAPPGSVRTSWHHNFTFTQKPDSESEAAWSSIIPVGRGFIHHPQLAPFISNIAVFHQLHCLHAIVVAYYDALSSQPMEMADIPDFDAETDKDLSELYID